ncbi:hypothetical protein [Streptomyces sp. TLI_55]|uniref:hypothetical protein n=1 Tax=Streptomyces sp. TLI_55 TaxID=1938861 RepID=UPI00211BDB11|nr:hypothetical protein [Streptomyces sp. TLI_55]
MRAYVQATDAALADPEACHGFTGHIETVCAMQAADRGFADILTMNFPGAPELETYHAQAYEGFLELIGRAKTSGQLREDFTSPRPAAYCRTRRKTLRCTRPCAAPARAPPPPPVAGSA